MSATHLPSIGPVRCGCLNCAPKPETPPMDWMPHPGFGGLYLKRDGEDADGWMEFCCWPTEDVYVSGSFEMREGDGFKTIEYSGFEPWSLDQQVTLAEIEEACADDPDHDWRLEIHGPLGGAVYQRQGERVWVPVERLEGFA